MLRLLLAYSVLALAGFVAYSPLASAALVSATLPASRSVQVGSPATLFATVINAGTDTATNCRIELASSINADIFFQTTDPATNATTGTLNAPVSISAGAAQSFLVGVTPNASLAPADVAFGFLCDGESAASIVGLNTLLLSASTTPVPDLVAIALTPSGDGVAQLPKESGLGFLSLATVNVGAAGLLTASVRAPTGVEGALLVCETNPADGSCLATAAANVDVNVPANGTSTFAVFASSRLALPLDPANRRLFVEFTDSTGAIRGSTSVAMAGGGPDIEPLLQPGDDGAVPLPDDSQASRQVNWLIEQLAESNTSIADINDHFAAGNATQWQNFLNQLRTDGYDNAKLLDVLFSTPVSAGMIIGKGGDGDPQGFMTVQTRYAGDGLITAFSVVGYGGSVQFFQDQSLTLEQAADDYMALGRENSLLIARVDGNNQCEARLARQADVPRALASVFKIWVLGAVAEAINDGVINLSDTVALDAAKFGQGGTINSEPLGTVFSLQDMATLMMGISDNTATDHMHALAGAARVDATVTDYGHATPDDMLPLLSISQAFSLYYSFPLADSRSYINGTEAEQYQFLNDRILPVGAVNGGQFFHDELLVDAFVKASPMDVCNAFASLRALPRASDGFGLVDKALGSAAAQPDIREHWDRVWYKGGNLVGAANGRNDQRVLTHAWFLESAERGSYVVVALANNRVSGNIDTFAVQSLTSRLLQLLREDVLAP